MAAQPATDEFGSSRSFAQDGPRRIVRVARGSPFATLACIGVLACTPSTDDARDTQRSTVVQNGDTLIFAGAATCGNCSVSLDPVLNIGHEADPASPEIAARLVRVSDGRFFLSTLTGVHGIGEYASNGAFVAIHGREGEGPGEYRRPPHSITKMVGDSLLVYDFSMRRFSVHDASGRFTRSFEVPFRVSDFAAMSDGSILVGGAAEGPDPFELGQGAHILDRDGKLVRSLGDSVGELIRHNPLTRSRTVAVSPSGVLAIARRLEYEFMILYPDGSRRIFERRADWFAPAEDIMNQAHLTNLWFDDSDMLWVSILLPERVTTAPAERPVQRPWGDRRFTVEIFDVVSGELVVSRTFEQPLLFHDGLAFGPRVSENGNVSIGVWIPALTGS
jgi:hypothetical protein